MPNRSTVIRWALFPERSSVDFVQQYARSRQIQAEVLADELFEVADDGSNDWQISKFGPMLNPEAVGRSRLRVDTRKWYLSKVLPKVYGEKVDHNHSGAVALLHKTDDEIDARLNELQGK